MGAGAESVSLEKEAPSRSSEATVQQATLGVPGAVFDPFVERLFGGAPANPPDSAAGSISIQRLTTPVLQRAQRLYGNRASQRIVMRSHALQRQCACGGTCAKCQEEEELRALQRHSGAAAPARFDGIPSTPGEPLDTATRRPLEAHFGADLSDVRVHTGSDAADSSTALDALAYTSGRDIYFAAGMYSPASSSGQHLLAHEVAHVVQQASGKEPAVATKSAHGVKIGAPDDMLEGEADQAAEDFMPGAPLTELTDEEQRKRRESSSAVQRLIQRQPKTPIPHETKFNRDDTVSSILISTISKTAAVWLRPAAGGSTYPLYYKVTKLDVSGGQTYKGFKDRDGLHIWKEGSKKDYLIYFSGSPDPKLLKFPPEFDVEVADDGGMPASAVDRGDVNPPEDTGPKKQEGLRVEIYSAAQFEALTGKPASQLPDGRLASADQISQWQLGPTAVLAGAGAAMVITPPPDFPLPEGATGILWDGTHMSDFAVVDGRIIARGFRAGLLRHGVRAFERWGPVHQLLLKVGRPIGRLTGLPFDTGLGPADISLNKGVPGSYADDFLFPYMPGSRAVYPLNPQPGAAGNLLKSMESAAPSMEGQTYRFSEPPLGHVANKYRLDANGCQLATNNCINLPAELHEEALGGKTLVLNEGQYKVDVFRGSVLNAEGAAADVAPEIGPLLKPGLASNIDKAFDQPEGAFGEYGLGIKPIGGTMLARGAAGVIRAGGTVLMIYAAEESISNIVNATPEERPLVIGQEAGGWTGGFVGNVLGSALGGAFVCAEIGPGAFFCALGFGIAGGITGGVIGGTAGRSIAQMLVDASKMTPAQMLEAGTMMFGTPEQKKSYRELRELETGEPDPFGL